MARKTNLPFSDNKPFYVAQIAFLTFLTWAGIAGVSFAGDDYQYLHSLAPIASWLDLFKPFFSHDINPSVFRPIANMTMVSDFLIYGWQGWGFHLTNLLLHVAASLVAYRFFQKVFAVPRELASLMALLFGALGSHDFNILTSTARADILVALFTMLTLLFEWEIVSDFQNGITRPRIRWLLPSLIAFSLALLSKEVAIVIPVLIVLLFWFRPSEWKWVSLKRGLRHILPHLVILVGYYFYHAHFTGSALASQPLQSEAATSPVALLRNGLYGLGYMFAPIDLRTATLILSKWKVPAMLLGGGSIIALLFLATRTLDRKMLLWLYRPFVFGVVTGSLVLLSFERWRLYTPSIAGVVILCVMVDAVRQKYKQRWVALGLNIIVPLYFLLNIWHAYAMSSNWTASSEKITEYKQSLGTLLAPLVKDQTDTLDVTFIDIPAKLGSVSVLQLGLEDIAKQGIAEKLYPADARLADARRIKLNTNALTEIYAFDRTMGFSGFDLTKLGSISYELLALPNTSTLLIPALGFVKGIARRDWKLVRGDTVTLEHTRVIVEEAEGSFALELRIEMMDAKTAQIEFKNGKFQVGTP